MDIQPGDIALLVYRHLAGTATPDEAIQLEQWLSADLRNREWLARISEGGDFDESLEQMAPDRVSVITNSIRGDIQRKIDLDQQNGRAVHRIHFLRTAWFRYAAAILIAMSLGIYFWNNFSTPENIAHTPPVPAKNDVLPGSDKAILTLSSGEQVLLSKATAGTIQDGSLSIQNTNGQLVYTSQKGTSGMHKNNESQIISYNTMTTPKGGQYQLTLADGTRVWLNAASSITYPTVFKGNTRKVSITGEAYFEVAKNKETPFIVTARHEQIEVLGTSFNINAYDNEPYNKSSLLEGSIKINNSILLPGQAFSNNKLVNTNIEQDIAWKNGMFDFDRVPIEQAMRQLERWYDIKVEYQGEIPDIRFVGGLDRSLTLQQVMETLKIVNINFKLNHRTLTVIP